MSRTNVPYEPVVDRSPFIDDAYDPIIVTVMPARFSEAELATFFGHHEALLARRRRYATLTDLSNITGLPEAITRRRIAEWNQRIEPQMRLYTIGTVVVAPSSVLRGAMTALNWLSPPPYPQEIVADRAAGLDALEALYRRVGDPVPPELARYRADLAGRRVAI